MDAENSGTRLFFKWFFAFLVLSVWSFFVLRGVFGLENYGEDSQIYIIKSADEINPITNFALEENSNLPLYVQMQEDSKEVIQKATFDQLLDILFKHEFSIQHLIEEIPADSCSIRAKDGKAMILGDNLGSNNKLSFNLNLPNAVDGNGKLTSQKSRDRFSFSFKIERIIQNGDDLIELKITGKGNYKGQVIEEDNGVLTFDKKINKTSILGQNFSFEEMEATFIKGCFDVEKQFLLINDLGELEEQRSIDEVRALLEENPEFINNYESLRRLFSEFWWLILPPGIVS